MSDDTQPTQAPGATEGIIVLAQIGEKPGTDEIVLYLRKDEKNPVDLCLQIIQIALQFAQQYRQNEKAPTIAVPKLHLPRRR